MADYSFYNAPTTLYGYWEKREHVREIIAKLHLKREAAMNAYNIIVEYAKKTKVRPIERRYLLAGTILFIDHDAFLLI